MTEPTGRSVTKQPALESVTIAVSVLDAEFRVAWRQGDSRLTTAACVRVVLETCGA